MSRPRGPSGPGISLFPFLAVLLCTMGALLVVLVMSVVHAGRSAEALVQLRHAADQGARAASMVRCSWTSRSSSHTVCGRAVSMCTPTTVRLAVSRTPVQVQVDVTDYGPCVAPADRAHVFEPFYRGERQPENAVRGTGIGLSIVQEFIHAHGGRVQVLQMPGDAPRSFFRIELPDVS